MSSCANQPEDLGVLSISSDLEASVLQGGHCVWLVSKHFDGFICIIDKLTLQRTILLNILVQLFNIKLWHRFPEQFNLLREIVCGHIVPRMQTARSEALLFRETNQVILHESVLVSNIGKGPHNRNFQLIWIIDLVARRVDKASDFDIWRVTMHNQ